MYYLGFSVELTCDTSNDHAWEQPSLNCFLWTQIGDQSCIYNHGSFLDLTALAGLVCGVGCEDPKLPLASHGARILVWRERDQLKSYIFATQDFEMMCQFVSSIRTVMLQLRNIGWFLTSSLLFPKVLLCKLIMLIFINHLQCRKPWEKCSNIQSKIWLE